MKTRSLIVLSAITAVAVVAAGAAVWQRKALTQVPGTPATLYPNLESRINDVAGIEVVIPGTKFSIVKSEDGSWNVPEKGGYPVEFATVKQAVVGMAQLKPLAPKTALPELHKKLNLVDPRNKGKGTYIGLKDKAGGELAAIIVGKTKSIATDTRLGWHYVRRSGDDRAWLAAGRIEVWDNVTRWLDSTMPLIKRARVRAAITLKAAGEPLTVSREDPDKRDFVLENVPEGKKVEYDTAPNALGSALGFLSFDDVRPAASGEFDDAPRSARFETFDGLAITIRLRQHGESWWASFGFAYDEKIRRIDTMDEKFAKQAPKVDEVKKEAEKLNATFAKWAYKLPKYKADDFLTDLDKLTQDVEKKEDEDKN